MIRLPTLWQKKGDHVVRRKKRGALSFTCRVFTSGAPFRFVVDVTAGGETRELVRGVATGFQVAKDACFDAASERNALTLLRLTACRSSGP